MKKTRTKLRASLAIVLVAASCGETASQSAQRSGEDQGPVAGAANARPVEPLAFTHATVIDPTTAAPQPNMTVVLEGGRITAVGRTGEVEVPSGATIVDAKDRFLIPGLWDAHAHVSYPGECALPLMIAHGITSVRDLGGEPAEGAAWRREIAEGKRVGPQLYLAGLNIESAEWLEAVEEIVAKRPPDPNHKALPLWYRSPRFKVRGPRDAQMAVDTAQRLGMDVVKFRNLSGKSFYAVAEAARRAGVPLAGHAPREVTLAEAAEAGLGSLEHGANLSSLATLTPSERAEQYRRIVGSGMFVTPTLVSDGVWAPDSLVLATFADTAGKFDARRRTLSAGQIELWNDMIVSRRDWSTPIPRHVHDSIFSIEVGHVREAYRAGVLLLAGTDLGTLLTFPGSSLHEELALLVERVGLTPLEALRSATILPAKFFDLEHEVGSIAPGKRADLVLLRADPLRDIRNAREIDGVVAAGRYFSRTDVTSLNMCKAPGS